MTRRGKWRDWLVFAGLAALTMGLAIRAGNSDFTYSDASRHAADGVFLLDLAAEHPLSHPVEWAREYYARSPALGIGRYPPLMAMVEAPFYAAVGVCPLAARLAAALVWLAGCLFFYEAVARDIGKGAAAFAAFALVVAPASVRWGSEVMLELPATAMLMAGAHLLFAYHENGRRRTLTWAVVLVCLAAWTKQPAALALVPLGAAVVRWKGVRAGARDLVGGIIAATVLLAPLAAVSFVFGRANLMLLAGAGRHYPLFSAGNWLYYLTQIPLYYLGWPLVVFLAAGIAALILRRAAPNALFWGMYAGVFYLFFTLVGYKSARLAMFWTPALAYLTGIGFKALASGKGLARRAGTVAAGAVALCGTLVLSAAALPATSDDVQIAALKALAAAPRRILYAGDHNGTFIFAMREFAGRARPTVVRASKVFHVETIQSELGVDTRQWTPDEIRAKIAGIAPDVVVIETEAKSPMRTNAVIALGECLKGHDFELFDTVYGGSRKEALVDLYIYLGPRDPQPLNLPMPGVGMNLRLDAAEGQGR